MDRQPVPRQSAPPATSSDPSVPGAPEPPAVPVPPFPERPERTGPEVVTPPLSGGTLLILRDGKTAVAADPDGDAIFIADLDTARRTASIALSKGDEPGRAVEDGTGRVHVVLRGRGAVVSVDPGAGTAMVTRPVCAAPRGIDFDAAADRLLVACVGGELMSLPVSDGPATLLARLPRDLRDVVVVGDRIYVSQFRSADVLVVSADGELVERKVSPGSLLSQQMVTEPEPAPSVPPGGSGLPGTVATDPASSRPPFRAASPNVAWRMIRDGEGVVMVHQESGNGSLSTERGGYGGGPCKSAVAAAVTRFSGQGPGTTSGQLMFALLPLDLAFSPDRSRVAIVSAFSNLSSPADRPMRAPLLGVHFMSTTNMGTDCIFPGGSPPPPDPGEEPIEFRQPAGQAIAVAFDGQGRVVAQTRQPARLEILTHGGGTIALDDAVRNDVGSDLFHLATFAGLSCASCHPEGGDDGRVWHFQTLGPRRTQNLRGGILDSAPFHWEGDMKDLSQLMTDVFSGRMGGGAVTEAEIGAMGRWMDALPNIPHGEVPDPQAVARGRALFDDPQVGCAKCHVGGILSSNQTVLVGTGLALQVPALAGVAFRAPYMHTGCAATLSDRLTNPTCGGGDLHGKVSHLSPAEIADLVAYMESL